MAWERRLWAAGHRATRQRALILDAVCAGGGHTTLGEVYARVRRADRTVDRSTVYRALHLFVELGIVLAADTGAGETVYEVAKPQPHHHLVAGRAVGSWRSATWPCGLWPSRCSGITGSASRPITWSCSVAVPNASMGHPQAGRRAEAYASPEPSPSQQPGTAYAPRGFPECPTRAGA
jgi:hypothetical protein